MSRSSRRAFLAGSGAITLTAVTAGVFVGPSSRADPESVRATGELLGAFFSDPGGARLLGEDRLGEPPKDFSALLTALAPVKDDPMEWVRTVTDSQFAQHVRRRVDAELERGDIVLLSGWQVSPTEATLCALWATVDE